MNGEPGVGRATGQGIRDLLRDTALLVTTLAPGGTVADAAGFRERCGQANDRFSDALTRRGYPADVRQEALVAQCGLLDETALRHLSAENRSAWALKPLQVERFDIHDAGERVFDCIEARLRETPANADLLECYSAILGMGFTGRYALGGEAKRIDVMAALDARLEKLRPSADVPFVVDRSARRLSDWVHSLSPWAVAGLACIVALIVWRIGSVALDTQLAQLVPAKVLQP
nr:DotU family type IV/VI secretion system protein [Paraburkholderia sp. BL21I4N1]